MFAKSTLVALFAALAAAQRHEPVGKPSGNAIVRPELGDIVVAGEPTVIEWEPSTPNTVSLVFLIDAPNNAHQAGPAIAEGIPNNGSIVWIPSGEYGSGDLGFGIQIIDDVTGQFQYSVNFGLSIPDDYETTPVSTSSSLGYPTKPTPSANSTSEYPTKSETTTYVAPTGVYPSGNSSAIYPTGSLTVPTSLRTTATGSPTGTTSSPPESTGAAAQLKVGLGMVAGVAGLFFML